MKPTFAFDGHYLRIIIEIKNNKYIVTIQNKSSDFFYVLGDSLSSVEKQIFFP